MTTLARNSTTVQDEVLITQVKLQWVIDQFTNDPWSTTYSDQPTPTAYLAVIRSKLREIINDSGLSETAKCHRKYLGRKGRKEDP